MNSGFAPCFFSNVSLMTRHGAECAQSRGLMINFHRADWPSGACNVDAHIPSRAMLLKSNCQAQLTVSQRHRIGEEMQLETRLKAAANIMH
jgi:hypothetical protein